MVTEKSVSCQDCKVKIRESLFAKHVQKVSHLHRARIRELLDKNCLSFGDIAREVGVSREWVRQVANKLGYKYPDVQPTTIPQTLRENATEWLRQIGRLGGSCRTKRKTAAARRNIKLASEARRKRGTREQSEGV